MRFVLILFILVFFQMLRAQINESDTMKVQIRTSITGTYQRGNVDMFAVKGRGEASFRIKKAWVIKTQNNILYQEFFKHKADNDIFSRNYIYYKPENWFYPYAIGYISSNFRRKIDYRYFAGLGGTYQALRKENHVLKFAANVVYESTRFSRNIFNYTEYDNSDKINVWRATLYLSGWNYVFKKHLRLMYAAGIDVPAWKGLSFNVMYSFTHENVVIKKIKQDDGLLTFGISYQFKK
jgi:hypothetical protein